MKSMKMKIRDGDYYFHTLENHLEEAIGLDWKNSRRWFFIAPVGSMNYHLDTEESDVDSKLILVPTLDMILHKERASSMKRDINRPFLNGICSMYDMREYFDYLFKMNPNFVETLFADVTIVNRNYIKQFQALKEIAEDIAYCAPLDAIRAMYNMIGQEHKKVVESKGRDRKAAYHCVRLSVMISCYFRGYDYKRCLCEASDAFGDFICDIRYGRDKTDEKVLDVCEKFYKSVQVEHNFFVSGDGPKEYRKGLYVSDVMEKTDRLQKSIIASNMIDEYKIVLNED